MFAVTDIKKVPQAPFFPRLMMFFMGIGAIWASSVGFARCFKFPPYDPFLYWFGIVALTAILVAGACCIKLAARGR